MSEQWRCQGIISLSYNLLEFVSPIIRVKGSFIVSGSQDCTVKLWSLKGLQEGEEPSKLSVKYTQLAHDKVRGRECSSGVGGVSHDLCRTSTLWMWRPMIKCL